MSVEAGEVFIPGIKTAQTLIHQVCLNGRKVMTDFFTHMYGLLLKGDGTVLIILYLGILCFWWYLIVSVLALARFFLLLFACAGKLSLNTKIPGLINVLVFERGGKTAV